MRDLFKFKVLFVFFFFIFLFPILAFSQAPQRAVRQLTHSPFPLPNSLKANFEFWRLVYSRYDTNELLFHDSEHLDVVYSVLNLRNLKESNLDLSPKLQAKASAQNAIDLERERIRKILSKFAKGDFKEKNLSPQEKKIYHLFDNIHEKDKFENAAQTGRIRAQVGQKDRFIQAMVWSGKYLPQIEEIFTSHEIPVELTRIIFVESMFNPYARSKVGASGIWQFMPNTARLFMKVNSMIDERNDPILSTHAAARLLKANYQTLGTWPLAINAYNSGVQSLVRAREQLGTPDIGVITHSYHDANYQFASRNFYAEFLAALEVSHHYKNYFGDIHRLAPIRYERLTLETPVSLAQLSHCCHIALETLKDLNPALNPIFFSSAKAVLPAGFSLNLPPGMESKFKRGIEKFKSIRSSNRLARE